MLVVLNSTPLIYVAKVGMAHLLIDLRLEKITSPLVKQEVVDKGKDIGAPEAEILEELYQKNVIKIVEPKRQELITRLRGIRGLHDADIHTIALAKEYDGMAIMDDQLARKTARIYKIRYSGTPYLLMRAHVQGLITKELVNEAVDDMISAGWRCGVEDYQSIMRYIGGFRR